MVKNVKKHWRFDDGAKKGKKVDGALKSFELFPRTLKNPLRVSHNLNPLTIRGGVGGQFL